MQPLPAMIPATKLRTYLSDYLGRLRHSSDNTFFVLHHRKIVAVLISLEEYNRLTDAKVSKA